MGNTLGHLFGEGSCIPGFLKRSDYTENEPDWMRADAFMALFSAVGMMLVVVWADILGHGLGFEPSASMIASLGNSRLFFLVGFTVAAILSIPLAKYGMSPSLMQLVLLPLFQLWEQFFMALRMRRPLCSRKSPLSSGYFYAGWGITRPQCSFIVSLQKFDAYLLRWRLLLRHCFLKL